MKHLKIYEELNVNQPEIGDYILSTTKHHTGRTQEPSIGKVISLTGYYPATWIIEFPWLNGKGKSEQYYTLDDIAYWSNDKEDLEAVLSANKYNL